MNKVNLCWVLSDGRLGHVIQSTTLAKQIAQQTQIHSFSLRQPWVSLAPRIIPGFNKGLDWHPDDKPDFTTPPDIIITTGRKAAAVGKFVTQRFKFKQTLVKHIQILNPKDAADNYDLLLLPEHDLQSGPNILTYCGSIHPYDANWFQQHNPSTPIKFHSAIIIGNPPKNYMSQSFVSDLNQIRQITPVDQPLIICGSPRLTNRHIKQIKKVLHQDDTFWFTQADGQNPYQDILHKAQHIFVTADSINMMNECAASQARVTLLAQDRIKSPKHHRFIESLKPRWSHFESTDNNGSKPPYAVDQILNEPKFQKLLNSPSSLSLG